MTLFTVLFTASVLVTAVRSVSMKSINENLQTNGLLKELLVGQQENANLIQKLLKDIEKLNRRDEQLSLENRNLKNKLKNLEKLQGKVIIFSCNISICQLPNQYLRDKKSLMFIFAANGIAFYVHLPEEEYSATEGSIIQYDQVVTNLGNGYNTTSGSFTALQHGYYVFNIFFQTVTDSDSDLGLFVNDNLLLHR